MIVECVNDQNWNPVILAHAKELPVKGNYYTVIKINHCGYGLGIGYVLEELNNPTLPNGEQIGFSAKRFKPVDQVDISEITEVLENEIVK